MELNTNETYVPLNGIFDIFRKLALTTTQEKYNKLITTLYTTPVNTVPKIPQIIVVSVSYIA